MTSTPNSNPTPAYASGEVAPPSLVNISGIISFVLNALTVFSALVTYALHLMLDGLYNPSQFALTNTIVTGVVVIQCLGAVVSGLLGVLQKHRPRLRWMAIGGLVASSTTLVSVIFSALGGFLYTAFA